MGDAVFEVDDCGGVDGDAEVACLEVEMCAGASACVATEGDRLAGFHELVGFDEEAAEVAVDGFEAIVVADNDIVAIATSFVFCEADFAGECSADGVADLEFEVNAVVHTTET